MEQACYGDKEHMENKTETNNTNANNTKANNGSKWCERLEWIHVYKSMSRHNELCMGRNARGRGGEQERKKEVAT